MEAIVKRLFDKRRLDESVGTNAWHLRQDGQAFPVKVHLYCEGDDDLSSEAEVSAFIIKTNSKDQDLARYILTAWMAMLIENTVNYDDEGEEIVSAVSKAMKQLPFKFQYPLEESELLSIFRSYEFNVDSLYEFIDEVRENIDDLQLKIKRSINQQFCRVRYGGKYDTHAGDSEIWFRISSVGYNWANTIYEFTSNMRRRLSLSHITICRDNESDNSHTDYFYKAKDGVSYRHMPIDEFLGEEHEHSLVFDSLDIKSGVLNTMWRMLESGFTWYQVWNRTVAEGLVYQRDKWDYFIRKERATKCK